MKITKIISFFLTFSIITFLFMSCEQEITSDIIKTEDNNINDIEQLQYYSQKEIQDLKSWLTSQPNHDNEKLDFSSFPELTFNPGSTNTDKQVLDKYFNGIMYLTEATINGTELNYSHDNLIEKVVADELLDKNAKSIILSSIQLSKDFLTSNTAIDFYEQGNSSIELRNPCGCDNIYDIYINYLIMCQAYGNIWGHCTAANNYYSLYLNCLSKEIICPPGFNYDGANCYSAVHFPK